jgi:Cu-Zn family superoxide dismutase
MLKTLKIVFAGLSIAVLAASCSQQDMQNNSTQKKDINKAVAVVHPTNDSNVTGTVVFTKEGDSVRVQGNISGLKEGKHGFHIHQYGDCRADDGSSAGGHYNPAGNEHAARTDSIRHMGDMGNITADADGNASIDYVDPIIKLDKIVGRAIVIHEGEDDLTSQPSGAAGPREGCGTIGIANPEE